MAPSLEKITSLLNEHGVKYILIGGWAAAIHGSARSTQDVDVVYARDRENVRSLARALQEIHPYLRGAPPGLLDLLGEVVGGGRYEELLPYSQQVSSHGGNFYCVTLERLIQLKRAAGRPKDLEVIAELQALLEERRRMEASGE